MAIQKKKRWIPVVAVALVIAAVAGTVIFLGGGNTKAEDSSGGQYQSIQPQTQALSITVTGDGYVRSKDRYSFYAQAAATVESVLYEEGESVPEGAVIATLRSDDLNTQIQDSLDSLSTLMADAEHASLHKNVRDINSPAKGRVKWMIASGDNLAQVQETYGAIGYIAPEKKMQVSIPRSGVLQVGDAVTLETDQGEKPGKVSRTDTPDGRDVVEIEDDTLRIQTVAVLSQQGTHLGEGQLLPVGGIPILGSSGIADDFEAEENDQVSKNEKLLILEEDYSEKTQRTFSSLRQAQDAHDVLLARQRDLVLRAPYDCIVTACDLHEGETVSQGTLLVSIIAEDDFEVVAAIDEMDIAYIQPGQAATVTFDAVRGETFEGTVRRKSTAGVHENGVTTFDVFLDLETDPLILSGMSADVEIVVSEHAQALMLPKDAIIYQGSDPYVRTPDGIVPVTLGALQGDMVEVVSGIDAGTTVLQDIPKTQAGGQGGGEQ